MMKLMKRKRIILGTLHKFSVKKTKMFGFSW
jgi:hypothetical protein